MRNEVLFKVIHHGHQLVEGLFIAAVAHQQLLSAEHFRHFRQHGGATVGDQVIRETTQHRVGGNPRKAVRSAALEAKLQLAQFAWLTFVVTHHLIKLMQMLKSRFHLIVLLLADHKVYALRIELTEGFTERVDLVVLTAQANHQHRPGVRVTHHVLQHGAGIDVIITQLRTAISVTEEKDAIGAFRFVGLFQKPVLNLTGDTIDTADGRQDPQFITHPDLPVRTTIKLHVAVGRLRRWLGKFRLIAILVKVAQVGTRIMGMNMFPWRNIRQRVANGQTILDDVFSLRNRA